MNLTLKTTLASFVLLATGAPGIAQEHDHRHDRESRRIKVEKRILAPASGEAVFVSADGETISVSPGVQVVGDGSHYVHLAGHRGFIGVQLTPLTPELREHFGVDRDAGVMVSKVLEGKPAEVAGVEVGDIITAVDGGSIAGSADLTRAIRGKEDGETVELTVSRNGDIRSLDIIVEERSPTRIVELHHGDGNSDDRRVVILPEIRFRDFTLDPDQLEKLRGTWSGTLELDDVQGVLENLGEYFSSEDWQIRLEQLEDLDVDEIEEKMKRVEERLRALELELAPR